MGSVKAKTETICSRIANIERDNLTEEERTQQIADLYKNIEQIAIYTAAYSVLSKVYDNYEKVYGVNSLKDTREKQAARLFGI